MEASETKRMSKAVSGFLRHTAYKNGVEVKNGGWIGISDLVGYLETERGFAGVTDSDVARLVAEDDKGRFQIEDGEIRAVSGHSFDIDLGHDAFIPGDELWFGTVGDAVPKIDENGLTGSLKTHARPRETYDEALAVAEGRRHESGAVVFKLDAAAMKAAGAIFTKAPNGEVLVPKEFCTRDVVEQVEATPTPGM